MGLYNTNDPLSTESTYYLFRKRINDYIKENNENLIETVFAQINKGECVEFEISENKIRTDKKLMDSNIARLSRYKLIHETLRLFYIKEKQSGKLDKVTEDRLDGIKVKTFINKRGVNGTCHTVLSTDTSLTFTKAIEVYNTR